MNKIAKDIAKISGKKLISLYIMGSYVTGEMTKHSDIDIIGIFKDDFSFRKEKIIGRQINEKYKLPNKIEFGAMSYNEFLGGRKKGTLTNHMDIRVFLNFLKNAKLIYGEDLDFDNFPVKPASKKFELKYHIRMFNLFKNEFRKKDEIRNDFHFRDFLKMLFYIASSDIELSKNKHEYKYSKIAQHFNKNEVNIIHITLKLRKKDKITEEDRLKWLNMASTYVDNIQRKY